MNNIKFKVDVSIDDVTGAPRAAYLGVRDGFVADTKEVVPGKAFADYGDAGELLGIEFLAPCTANVLSHLTEHEPNNVQTFLNENVPHGLVCV